ncbi:MAG: transcription-repair coupling factor [Candidatus Cloacimonetes bacterium]|nr:transcription-repair coupling factor [Candidatus Cloacimonadota bacterium]
MFYEKLKNKLEKSDFFRLIQDSVKSNSSGILFYNLNVSSKALIVAEIAVKSGKNIVFVSADDRLSEIFCDDLEILLGRDRVFSVPDFEVLPYEERSPHYSIRKQRISALVNTVIGGKSIYTVSIRSLLRKIVPGDVFEKNIMILKPGREINLDVLVSRLVGMGYDMNFQVAKVGDVARRGGIVDVFSPNYEKPLRIDFWGDEIESVRHFSVINQRSEGSLLESVVVEPAREFSIFDVQTKNKNWKKVQENGFYEGIEQDVSLIFKETETFLDYLKDSETILIYDEFQNYKQYCFDIMEETVALYEKSLKNNSRNLLPKPEQLFEGFSFIKHTLNNHQHFFLSNSTQVFTESSQKIEAPFTSQTVLHSNLSLLENELRNRLDDDYSIFIQSDNKSQSKRMVDLLPEYENSINFSIGVFHRGFNLEDGGISVFTDHEIFSRYKSVRSREKFSQEQALIDYESLKPGDYIVHIDHGIGVYEGLNLMKVGGNTIECLSIRYADGDYVYVPTFQLRLISKFVSDEGVEPSVHKIGGKRWQQAKQIARKQIELVAQDLVDLFAERKMRKGITFKKDNNWQTELEDSFVYEDTPDQRRSSQEIKADMESENPMERLLCGDVGFGKTEVAVRAAFKAVMSGYQVAVLVPTTLLAEQHYLVFKERIAQYPVEIEMFSRFRQAARMKKDIVRLAEGQIDIAIGTHRLISKDIKFKRLGLLIIDEEHRFGVRHKSKLLKLKSNVDTLYMSATPIPRTLSMALSRLKEMSLIQTSPKERLPVRTVIINYDEEVIKDAINRELDRGGQVYFIHNRVQTIDSVAVELSRLVPKAKIRIGHGQLPEKILEEIMMDFTNHNFDILVATTIVESGIDIPNANTMIINRADMFGLAQLYQLRGRVGRSNRRAYAYLIIPKNLSEIARKRLETLTEYNTLGAGYQIAMRDLELRGAGSLLGTKQSGVINSVGFNYYNRLLEQAIKNLEEKNPLGLWDEEDHDRLENVNIEADYYFPANYIADEKVRLEMYKRMLAFRELTDFDEFTTELNDRFGEMTEIVSQTIDFYRIKFLTDKSDLASFKIVKDEAVLEFDNRKLPSKEKIGQLLNKFELPVRFDTVNNFKIIFRFLGSKSEDDKKNNLLTAIEILKTIYEWKQS